MGKSIPRAFMLFFFATTFYNKNNKRTNLYKYFTSGHALAAYGGIICIYHV